MAAMYDLVIHGGTIIDGTGSPWFKADVAIEGGRISGIGKFAPQLARHSVDATGRVVCPGFIDIHTHSDLTIIISPRAESTLAQGITTQIAGNCGVSAAPTRDYELYYGPLDPAQTEGIQCDWLDFSGYFQRLEATGIGTNYASLVGHGNLRAAAIGYANRPATPGEIDEMKELAAAAMAHGALGMSTGLAYIPGSYAGSDEVVEIAKVVAAYGGTYTSHIRNQTDGIETAVKECIDVGRRTGMPAHISHMQPGFPKLGCTCDLLGLLDRERAAGHDISCDAVPYTIGSTTLKSMLPPWACEGGDAALLQRLRDPATRERIKNDTMTNGAESGGSRKRNLIKEGRWDVIWLASAEASPELSGKSFEEIAARRQQDPHDALLDILIEEEAKPWMLAEDVSETDVVNIARHPTGGIISDGFSLTPNGVLGRGKHHPRSYGAFPRFLRHFVREQGLLSWEAAIHKLTGYPASRFRLGSRGILREGMAADILVFDPASIGERASYADPYQFPIGVEVIVLNGCIALQDGTQSESLYGRVLRSPEARQ
jgi:N-acyl-D-aspartate/D-glutamate deacylase